MYLDPGFGSMLIQVLVAAIAVIGGYWAAAKGKFKQWFGKKPKDKGSDETP
jgi:hypothetical protein